MSLKRDDQIADNCWMFARSLGSEAIKGFILQFQCWQVGVGALFGFQVDRNYV